MKATLHKTTALLEKDFIDLVRNPTLITCCLFPIAFVAFFKYLIGANAPDAADALQAEALATAARATLLKVSLCATVSMVGVMCVLYGLAEEREKHTLRTLTLADVSAYNVAASRALVALAASLAVGIACFFLASSDDLSLLPPYLGILILGLVPVELLALVFGIGSRDQTSAGIFAVPVMILGLSPIYGTYGPDIAAVTRFAPTGGADELMELVATGTFSPAAAGEPLAVTAAWALAGLAVFVLLFKRLSRDN